MSELRLELMFQAIDQSVSAQFRQHGTVEQRAILMTHRGLLAHPLGWESDEERAAQLKALQVRMREVEPKRYALIGEAWVADWIRGDTPLLPSKSEVRKECLYVFLRDMDVGEATLTFPMADAAGRNWSAAEIRARTELVLAGRFARIATVEEALAQPSQAIAA